MKKLLFILAAIALLSSCHHYSGSHGEKTQKDAEAEFVSGLSQSDSTSVLDLTEKFMQSLQAGKIEDAVDMIYVLYQNVLYAKSESFTTELYQRFAVFPVKSFKRDYYSFSTEGNNDVCYTYEFASHDKNGNAREIKLMFNPVCVDGKWYLTLKEPNQSSKNLLPSKQIHELAPAPEKITLNTRR